MCFDEDAVMIAWVFRTLQCVECGEVLNLQCTGSVRRRGGDSLSSEVRYFHQVNLLFILTTAEKNYYCLLKPNFSV